MGKGESKLVHHTIPLNTLRSYQEEYEILGLTRNDICLLHNIFREIQHNHNHNQQRKHSNSLSSASSPFSSQQKPTPCQIVDEGMEGREGDRDRDDDEDEAPLKETIRLERIFEYFSIEETSFTRLLFMSFDIDLFALDEIDFPRFLQAIWNFCSLDDEALSMNPSPPALSHPPSSIGFFLFLF